MTLFQEAETQNLVQKIQHLAKNKRKRLYIVGGFLRDAILKRRRPNPDVDFCLKKNAINFGRLLAKDIKAGFVVLDQKRGYCRLVKKINDKIYTLDFTDFRGATLEEDLLHRDFTINAIALELERIFVSRDWQEALIDPYGGIGDLKSKVVRITYKRNFIEDPLRILRALSLAAIFGFKIDQATLKLMQQDKKRLTQVSAERLRDELFKIFDVPNSFDYLLQMDKLKILGLVIPEIEYMRGVKQGPYHHLDVLRHSLETIRQLEALMLEVKNNQEIQTYLDEVISSERKRRALMKLGALLHDIGKPQAKRRKDKKTIFHGHERIGAEICEEIVKRLKLSNDEEDALRKMVFWHLRPGYLGDNEEVSARAQFRYFRDTAGEGVSTLLLSIADQRSTRGPLTSKKDRLQHEKICFGLIKEYFRKKKEAKPVRLINGDQLMKKFKLQPSPLIGKILAELDELQAIGKIKTQRDAFHHVRGRFSLTD